jgi:hypothetical protein
MSAEKMFPNTRRSVNQRVQQGLAAIQRGQYTDYMGREGLHKLAAEIKARGRNRLARTSSNR